MNFNLTDIEVACGVTLDKVTETATKTWTTNSRHVVLPKDTGPALAGATARYILRAPVDFVGLRFGYPVYEELA